MVDLDRPTHRRVHPVALAGLMLALLAALLLFLSGPGTRMGFWHFRTAFKMMGWAAYAGGAAALVSIAGLALARGRGRALAAAGLVIGALMLYLPWSWRNQAYSVPPIHDITTDTQNPPAFVAIAPLRKDAPNPPEYAGDSIARQQLKAYPDIKPLMLAMPVDSAFTAALTTARDMGWELVDQNRRDGRIEATATTPFMGFKDDVVIRVSSASGISRVDVRSKSRVGGSDVGANARRIRAYLDKLRQSDPAPVRAE
ncbi:MAG TPA: DUF1499 domain-containing protein [Longimicrobium sp.]|jgi:uncharacterized protein (DUF1499 family)|uniref:DUF1499 domain-containing protein n=1 Tax=Longimicrobium sp. TaxID=2029185 RepID=UPI002EDAE946